MLIERSFFLVDGHGATKDGYVCASFIDCTNQGQNQGIVFDFVSALETKSKPGICVRYIIPIARPVGRSSQGCRVFDVW